MKRYLKLWLFLTGASFSSQLQSRFGSALFLLGKLLRFFFFLVFLLVLSDRTKSIAGYTVAQTVLFFLTFNLIDVTAQMFLRGVYLFRELVVTGNFDYVLAKPIHPLFQILANNTDVLDLITLPPLLLAVIYMVPKSVEHITFVGVVSYVLLFINAFLIALSLHILVVSIGVLTTEVDNTIMLYRDLTSMGRLPVDIYREPLRAVVTFAIPVGVMMTFPAKALMGLLSLPMVGISLALGMIFLLGSLSFWRFAVKRYTSASS
ncbi:MAG TPA: ABC-2 family transporter protein [Patescibacteria group bacterium]|nr:ABC-2 family transporter protein [Patescibacteria group bacterium]